MTGAKIIRMREIRQTKRRGGFNKRLLNRWRDRGVREREWNLE